MENKKITYENGKITAYGKKLSMLGDMYCLNDLFEAMDNQGIDRAKFGVYARKKSFLRLVKCFTGADVCNTTFVVANLCDKGLMKRVGRGEERKLYVSLPILWCILTDYNETLTKDASNILVLKRKLNSVG